MLLRAFEHPWGVSMERLVVVFRPLTFPSESGNVLLTSSIQTADEHRTAVAIEPGLNAVADVDRSINSGVLIVWDTDFLPLGILDKVGTPF